MVRSEKDKMRAGAWYTCRDPELEAMQVAARTACHVHNTAHPGDRVGAASDLTGLFARWGQGCLIEAPFHCAYGVNIHLGDHVYMNAGCTVLDTAAVDIGDHCMFGPGVQIYCARHHTDRAKRTAGLEMATPVLIGSEVWVGGGAIILPGVRIGDGAIIGAGAVVLHDVDAGTTVVGNPARVTG